MRRRAMLAGSMGLAAGWLLDARGGRGVARAQPPQGGPDEDREPENLHAMTPEERVHAPVLVLPERVRIGRPFDLVVQVGVSPHPMAAAHHIDRVEVLLDEHRAFLCELSPSVAFPVVRVPLVVAEGAMLVVRARCNLHGTWRTRRALVPT